MNVRYIDYRSKEADKYIESDKFLKNTYGSRRDRDQYNGEIAIDGDEVAGYIFVGDKTDKGFINSLKVYDNYRRNGIASKLLNDAIHKYGGVDLTVKKDNTIALNMYKKRGFVEDPDYTHGNMMYMKLSKSKNESVVTEKYSYFDPDKFKKVPKSIKLYHGSRTQNLKKLVPKNDSISRIGNVSAVYATKDKRFAACYGTEWRDGIAKQGTWDNWKTVVMGISDKVDMDSPCSLYELENDGSFVEISNKEVVSTNTIKVAKEYKYQSYKEMLKKNGVKMISYDEYIANIGSDNPTFNYIESSVLQEMPILNGKDIYYNKDKFDSGEINLCFITGHSGSGKSTMAHSMESKSVEVYELDDIIANKLYFSMDNLKEYGDLIYSFFKGLGNKYYYTEDDVKNRTAKEYKGDYDRDIINDFINYSIIYAKSHKNKKYIIEGVWLFKYISPEILKDYAVYIKGTSRLISDLRAAKRDSNNDFPDKKDAIKRDKAYLKRIKRFFTKDAITDEKNIGQYRKYFSDLEKKPLQEFSRSNIPESEFGVPNKRKFPLDTPERVKSAIRFFNYVDPSDEAELAKRIKEKAKKFGVVIRCGKKNRLSKYITKEYVNEFMSASAIGNDAYAVINGSIKQAAYQNGYKYIEDDEYPYTKKSKESRAIHKNTMMKNNFTDEE